MLAADRAARGLDADDAVALLDEAGRRGLQAERRAAGPGVPHRQRLRLEPAVLGAVAGLEDGRRDVREAVADLVAWQQLDVGQAPAVLHADPLLLALHAGLVGGAEEVALLAEPDVVARQIGDLGEPLEQVDAFADERDLLGVVELEAERASGDRGGQGTEGRALLEDDGGEAGPSGEERRGGADDAAADHDEIGRARQGVGVAQGRQGSGHADLHEVRVARWRVMSGRRTLRVPCPKVPPLATHHPLLATRVCLDGAGGAAYAARGRAAVYEDPSNPARQARPPQGQRCPGCGTLDPDPLARFCGVCGSTMGHGAAPPGSPAGPTAQFPAPGYDSASPPGAGRPADAAVCASAWTAQRGLRRAVRRLHDPVDRPGGSRAVRRRHQRRVHPAPVSHCSPGCVLGIVSCHTPGAGCVGRRQHPRPYPGRARRCPGQLRRPLQAARPLQLVIFLDDRVWIAFGTLFLVPWLVLGHLRRAGRPHARADLQLGWRGERRHARDAGAYSRRPRWPACSAGSLGTGRSYAAPSGQQPAWPNQGWPPEPRR